MADFTWRLPEVTQHAAYTLQQAGERIPYALTKLNIPKVWETTQGLLPDGTPLLFGVIDSGVLFSHPDLQGRIKGSRSVIPGESGIDENGHGTHVIGTMVANEGNDIGIPGLAPLSQVLSIQALNALGQGTDEGMQEALKICVDEGCLVVNISAGMRGQASDGMRRQLEYAAKHQVPVIVAAGNDGGGVNAPANDPLAVAVSSVDRNGNPSHFTSRGEEIDIACYGEHIFSTSVDRRGQPIYVENSGTSMAAPHITAGCGLAICAGDLQPTDPERVKRYLRMNARDVHHPGRDPETGPGIFDPSQIGMNVKQPEGRTQPLFGGLFGELHSPARAGDFVSWGRGAA